MGVLPHSLEDVNSNLLSATGNIVPSTVSTRNKQGQIVQPKQAPAGLPVQYTIIQQGFTADVSCGTQVLNATTSPSVVLGSSTNTIFNQSLTLAQLAVICPGDTVADTFYSSMAFIRFFALYWITALDISSACYNFSERGCGLRGILPVQ